MDHHEHERRKSRQEMLPAAIIALLAAFGVAMMCWIMQSR